MPAEKNILHSLLCTISIVLVFFVSTGEVLSQSLIQETPSNDKAFIPLRNYLDYGVDKVNNTYVFTANLHYRKNFQKGGIDISQSYRGLGLNQNSKSFRDDENFSLSYHYPVLGGMSALIKTNWFYSSDTRTRGQNELNRLNGLAGMRYADAYSEVELAAGYEHNKQLTVESPGFIIDLNSNFRDIRFSNYALNARLDGEYLSLNLDRTNADLDFYSDLTGNFGRGNLLDFNLGYRLMNRDLLSTWLNETDFIPIEQRLENKLYPGFNIGFNVFDGLSGSVGMHLTNTIVDKSYNSPVEQFDITKMTRQFHEFQFGINGLLQYKREGFSQIAGLIYSTRSEENKAFKKFDISAIDEEEIKELERMRDNNSLRTKLYLRTLWRPVRNDTFRFDFSSSIYRYDTPSEKNYDDRDEFALNTGISYMHRLHSGLSAGLFVKVQMLHLVFLKAERSAMNNWNRILRFGPQVKWRNKVFSIEPQFEIIANYTAYDFDDITDNIRSYSFRQLGYRDSLCIYLDKDVSLQGRISVRYFERGILYWDSFSESPQNSNLEYFIKMFAYTRLNDIVSIGAGLRIYSLEQRNIAGGEPSRISFSQNSWGPETVVTVKFLNGSTISLQGWYEFQYINKLMNNKIPNLFLLTNISI